ncbi:MAG: cysteine desulfurase [Lachnospiraceae bacterium]|jgi:cysteine desulfurase|nr:cysteine desulfurase [Lachnospiraceae bacterium]
MQKKEIYLDNSATTAAYPEVGDLVRKVMCDFYGNPSSLHMKGIEAEKYIKQAKETFAEIWKCKEKEIYFTSGGTESDNLAIIGTATANTRRGKHIISTCIEHPAVINTLKYLEENGFEITFLPVDSCGLVSVRDLKEALRKDTILVSVMQVNNEIGGLQPIEDMAKVVKEFDNNILFHTDAVQGFGKYRLYPKRSGIDLISVSAHKIHGPKGAGALYVREGVKIKPIMFGGGQQNDLRSGTENVPGTAGLALAAKTAYASIEAKTAKMRELKNALKAGIGINEGIKFFSGDEQNQAPHILSIGFSGIKSEVLLHALEGEGIFVSSGSACASNHPGVSSVLKSIGAADEYLESTLRFSLSEFTTEDEIDYTVNAVNKLLPVLRKFVRK